MGTRNPSSGRHRQLDKTHQCLRIKNSHASDLWTVIASLEYDEGMRGLSIALVCALVVGCSPPTAPLERAHSKEDAGELDDIAAAMSRAKAGDAKAQFHIGLCLFDGNGVTQDRVEAVKWFREAGSQGLDKASCLLGACYMDGTGVAKDEAEAVKWYRKAAEAGNAVAQGGVKVLL